MATRPLIIYDDACPLCQAYTAGFARMQWADRTGFSQADPGLRKQLDLDRSRHEIPLYDPETASVRYGLDALFTLIGRHVRLLRPVLRWRLTKYLFYPLYLIITYNRRVIAGTPPPPVGFDCAPDYHRGWRWVYVGLALLGSAALLSPLLTRLEVLPSTYGLGGAILLMLTATLLRHHRPFLVWLGHWATLLLIGALLAALLPLHWLSGVVIFLLVSWTAYRRRWLLLTGNTL